MEYESVTSTFANLKLINDLLWHTKRVQLKRPFLMWPYVSRTCWIAIFQANGNPYFKTSLKKEYFIQGYVALRSLNTDFPTECIYQKAFACFESELNTCEEMFEMEKYFKRFVISVGSVLSGQHRRILIFSVSWVPESGSEERKQNQKKTSWPLDLCRREIIFQVDLLWRVSWPFRFFLRGSWRRLFFILLLFHSTL